MLAAVAQPAAGVVVDAGRELAQSPNDSSSTKSVTAICPAGKQLMGAGGEVVSGLGQVIFDDLTPGPGGVTVKGAEDETGNPGSWDAEALAICGPPLPGLQRVSATSPLDSSNKSVTATCPAGKRVVGTGSDINAGNGQVGIDDMRPSPDLTSVTVQALEDQNGQAGPWNVIAYAMCANPIAGLERVSATSALNSDANKAAIVACPNGKSVVGMGSDINAGVGQVQQIEVFANDALTEVDVLAIEDEDTYSGPWSVTAFAICADAAVRVVAVSSNDSAAKTVGVTCPTGKRLSGTGAEITGGFGQVGLHFLIPTLDLTNVTGAAFEDETGTPNNWSLRSYGICHTPLPGQVRVLASSAIDSTAVKTAFAACPAGTKVIGGSGAVAGVGAEGQVFISRMSPNQPLSTFGVIASEDETGTGVNWSVTAYAICANPPPGLEVVFGSDLSGSDELFSHTTSCPAGKYLLGGSGGIAPSTQGEVRVDDLRPNAALNAMTVTGIEDETEYSGDWSANAEVICANR